MITKEITKIVGVNAGTVSRRLKETEEKDKEQEMVRTKPLLPNRKGLEMRSKRDNKLFIKS